MMKLPDQLLSRVHPTAVVGDGVVLGEAVTIGPFACIEDAVIIGADSAIAAHAVVRVGSRLGAGVRIDSFASIGGDPQSIGFDTKIASGVVIGDRANVREGATVNRSTNPGESTRVGAAVLLMANSHVGHDCVVGDHVVLANNVMLAGHVRVGANSFIGGGAGVHQFVRIGTGVMIGGNAAITRDVPPFTMVADRDRIGGLNLVGLRRNGATREDITDLKLCYHEVFRCGADSLGSNVAARAAAAAAGGEIGQTTIGRQFLEFFLCESKRGFVTKATG